MKDGRPSVLGFLSCLLFLGALCFYSARFGSAAVDTIPEIRAKGRSAIGQEVALTSDVKVVRLLDNGFIARQGGAQMEVTISDEVESQWNAAKHGLAVGDFVSLRAVCKQTGLLEAREFHVHKGRRLKIWVSIAALLAAAAILFVQFRKGKYA
ncbi:MAG: hypothetical protein EHM61_00865 [Acidobacteria bacterium]|nr:MAG: hypothetical protein EHM61_00865 [Acidobacteriota bacterium]